MTQPPPDFTEPPEAPRCVLSLAGELTAIQMWASSAGFQIRTHDQSALLLDEAPESERATLWLTWDAAWDNQYPNMTTALRSNR